MTVDIIDSAKVGMRKIKSIFGHRLLSPEANASKRVRKLAGSRELNSFQAKWVLMELVVGECFNLKRNSL